MLEEIAEGTSDVKTVEELFKKMREEFGELNEESRKVDELKVLVQRSRMYDKFVQIFKRAVRESRYKERALVEEFKRWLNRTIKRRLAEAELPPSMIMEW